MAITLFFSEEDLLRISINELCTRLVQDVMAVCPIYGVTATVNDQYTTFTASFKSEATSGQQDDANAILAAANVYRSRRSLSGLMTDIQALSSGDKDDVYAGVAAAYLQQHPKFATVDLGINVPGDENSLANAAKVTNVTCQQANGTYHTADTPAFDIDITFDQIVNVDTSGGTPSLGIAGVAADAGYTTGNGTDTLTFNFTINTGDATTDLDYDSTAALVLNSGEIFTYVNHEDTSSAHVPAFLTLPEPGAAGSLGANKDIVIEDP